ncbi:MAG: o-succinylbenzoate synthase [Gemmatimonadetes bacterium]|nr:MAG: o-succinylbenzoate synthase [Gemmatimonadota bacterium]
MNLTKIDLFRYSIPFIRPLQLLGTCHTHRTGLILQIWDDANQWGWGEIAPFPGLHPETLAEAQNQLIKWMQAPDNTEDSALYPTVRFGVESARWHLNARRHGTSMARWIQPDASSRIYINGLITLSDDIEPKVSDLLSAGYRSIKMKVGQLPLQEDIARVKQVGLCLQGRATLRLDANRAWTFDQAIEFMRGIDPVPVEYIEEPLIDPTLLPKFAKKTAVPVALDESLLNITSLNDIPYLDTAAVIIIKPSVVGGIAKTLDFFRIARDRGIQVVISSAFHTSVGLAAEANLAACLQTNIPMGLDTSKWLQTDVLLARFISNQGCLDLANINCYNLLNLDVLEEISCRN